MKELFRVRTVIITAVISVLIFASPRVSANTLKFAQISDIHYSLKREDTSYKLLSETKPLLEDAVLQINKKKGLDFVIITGDGIDKPEKSDLDSLLSDLNKLKYRYYYVSGNHDIDPEGELTKSELLKTLNEKTRNHGYDSLYYTFKPARGFRVIVLDCALNDKRGSSGFIPAEELFWLDDILKKSKRDTVIIFSHFPLLPPLDSKSHEITNAEELNNIISKYKMPIAIFSGHYHTARIKKEKNVLHVSTPSLAGYPNAYRTVTADKNIKRVLFDIELNETGLKDIQKKAKITALGGSIYYGREKDRNTIITIKK